MALRSITADGVLSWACPTKHCDFHESLLTAHVSHTSVRYEAPRPGDGAPGRAVAQPHLRASGAVIALPPCLDCGSRVFLKADYVPDDLMIPSMFFHHEDELGNHGHFLKPIHTRNFRLFWLLKELSKFPETPLLPMIPVRVIEQTPLSELSLEVVDGLWLRYILTGQPCLPELSWIDDAFKAIAPDLRPLSLMADREQPRRTLK